MLYRCSYSDASITSICVVCKVISPIRHSHVKSKVAHRWGHQRFVCQLHYKLSLFTQNFNVFQAAQGMLENQADAPAPSQPLRRSARRVR